MIWNEALVSPWWGFVFLLAVSTALAVGAIASGWFLRPRHPQPEKDAPYECGNPDAPPMPVTVPIRYYSVAMLFLLFDAEAVLLWPWAVACRHEGLLFLIEALVFLLLAGCGYLYAWGKGAFEWTRS